jgi:hypothetical protein
MQSALSQENWYAALMIALTIPDICGRLENPKLKSQERFVKWYDQYLQSYYQSEIGHLGKLHIFLSGRDLYALRCAYLHQGEFEIDDQRAQDVLESFVFGVSSRGNVFHCNQIEQVLHLDVLHFCQEITAAVQEWQSAMSPLPDVLARINRLGKVEVH